MKTNSIDKLFIFFCNSIFADNLIWHLIPLNLTSIQLSCKVTLTNTEISVQSVILFIYSIKTYRNKKYHQTWYWKYLSNKRRVRNFLIWSCSTIIVKLLCDVCFQKMQDGFDNMRYRKHMKRNKTKEVSLNKDSFAWERKRERKEWKIDKLSENGGNIIRKQIILFWKYASCR